MKFEVVVDELFGAKSAGYRFDTEHSHLVIDPDAQNEFLKDWNPNRLSNKIDSFLDFESELYRGEDGEFYAVEFIYPRSGGKMPLCWWKLVKA